MALDSIVGHARIVALLGQAAARRRVPQSLLFAGPDGVGKRTTAVALAQEINCPATGARTASAARTCADRVARGLHSDVALIDRGDEASIKIKLLRERVLDAVGYRPFESERRIFIIDGAEDMTPEAQDALLKTLEEPPSSAILILVTAQPDTLLPTIQSRCRRLRFGPLSMADVERVLAERCAIAPKDARTLAEVSGGSVSHALAVNAGDVDDDRETAIEVLRAAAAGRSVAVKLKAATRLAQHKSDRRDREALTDRLSILASLLRDVAAVGGGSVTAIPAGDAESLARDVARGIDVTRASEAFAAVDRAQEALAGNASPKLVADWISLTI